ncbi:unnamed protein product, partial [Ectocarpus sp. 4 AP-2014]
QTSTTVSRTLWHVALLVGTGTVLGISTTLAKLAGEAGIAPLPFLSCTVFGSSLLLVGLAVLRRDPPPVNGKTLEYYALAGLLSLAAPNLIYFAAAPRIGAGYVALSLAFPPLYTYAGALLLGLETFVLSRAIGVMLALAAVSVLAAYKISEPAAEIGWIAAVLAAPVFLAIGNLYRVVRWPAGTTPAQLAPGMLVGSLAILALAWLLAPDSLTEPWSISPWIGLLIVAQTMTFAGFYYLFFVLLDLAGPVYVSFTGSIGAVAGAAIAIALLGEPAPGGLLLAAVLTGAGVVLVTRRKSGQPQNDPGA